MIFADPKNDLAFKKIFGDNKKIQILISFLNSVLELPSPIKSLKIASPYQVPKIKDLKNTSLDVKAVDKNGREFIVEMQVEGNDNFGKRATYYLAKSYAEQIKKAEDYIKLKPAYFVGILDFNLFEGEKYLTRHIIINQETQRQDLKDFEFNFIELKKFKKNKKELVDVIDKWIFFIKNAENIEVIPNTITEKEILEAFDSAKKVNWTKKELNTYDYLSMKKGDRKAQIKTAKKAGEKIGREEGLKEGEKKGREDEKIEIVLKSLKEQVDIKLISIITGLTVKDILKIKDDNK